MPRIADNTNDAAILKARKAGKSLGEVAEQFKTTPGKVAFIEMCANVEEKDRIKFRNDDELTKKIVTARKTGASWGLISARSGVSEGKIKRLATEAGLPTKTETTPKTKPTTKTSKTAKTTKPATKTTPAKRNVKVRSKVGAGNPSA